LNKERERWKIIRESCDSTCECVSVVVVVLGARKIWKNSFPKSEMGKELLAPEKQQQRKSFGIENPFN